jgi:hypothetical protein
MEYGFASDSWPGSIAAIAEISRSWAREKFSNG